MQGLIQDQNNILKSWKWLILNCAMNVTIEFLLIVKGVG